MAKKYDAVTPRPKYGEPNKVWWHRVGNGIMNDKGQISIYLDSVPVPDPERENKIVIMLFESKDREEKDQEPGPRSKSKSGGGGGRRAPSNDIDDEIPF